MPASGPSPALDSGQGVTAEPEVQLEIQGFTMRLSDPNGEIRTVLGGDRLQRLAGSDLDRIDDARLELFDDVGLLWVWTAPRGQYDPGDHAVWLSEPTGVRMPRPEQPGLRIDSLDARILVDERIVITEKRVTVQHAGLLTTGVGMRARLEDHQVEWFSAVETEYRPDAAPVPAVDAPEPETAEPVDQETDS